MNICCDSTDAVCNYCGSSDYATGISANKKTCVCAGNLKWNAKGINCGCTSPNSAIVQINGKYDCKACSGKSTTTPVIEGTKCTCAKSLIWSDTAADCTCSDVPNQIYVNSLCITCDANINAKDKKSDTECNCLVSTLKWNKVACECKDSKSISIVSSSGTVTCESCTSDRINGVTRVTGSINECKCPNNLVWDPTTLSCICTSNQLVIQGLAGTGKCVCAGATIQPYNEKPCITCESGLTLTSHECRCTSPKIWNNYYSTCIDPPASCAVNPTSRLSCKCASPLVFDVVTKKCTAKCTGSALCLDCTQIPYTVGSAIKYDPKSSNIRVIS